MSPLLIDVEANAVPVGVIVEIIGKTGAFVRCAMSYK